MRTETMDRHTSVDHSVEHSKENSVSSHYMRFAAMIGTSAVLMYAFMYLNSYDFDHVRWSTTRLYMTLIMTATMAVVMLSYMLSMMKNTKANISIYAVSAIVFIASLVGVRSQTFVHDESWMKAMIPHHSIAVLTSERAGIEDVRVKALASKIIDSQRREISEMDWLISDINNNGIAKNQDEAATRPVPSF